MDNTLLVIMEYLSSFKRGERELNGKTKGKKEGRRNKRKERKENKARKENREMGREKKN